MRRSQKGEIMRKETQGKKKNRRKDQHLNGQPISNSNERLLLHKKDLMTYQILPM